jgi:hypothetical protein
VDHDRARLLPEAACVSRLSCCGRHDQRTARVSGSRASPRVGPTTRSRSSSARPTRRAALGPRLHTREERR